MSFMIKTPRNKSRLPEASDRKPESGKRSRHHVTGDRSEISKDLYRKSLNTALRILTGRDHSKYELEQKLKQRGISGQLLDNVISTCERYDYINDERTVQVYIRQLKRKGYGLKRIRYELTKKGLKGNRIHDILSGSLSEADERECAQRVLQKHLGRFEREKDSLKRRAKIYRFLYARGFSEGVISELMKKVG
jgi:regulatory protein